MPAGAALNIIPTADSGRGARKTPRDTAPEPGQVVATATPASGRTTG